MNARKIVVVDDDLVSQKKLCDLLESQGYEISGCGSDGFDAVALCEQHRPDAVFIEIETPVFSGLEAAREIIKKNHTSCVILISLRYDVRYLEAAREMGAMDYLIKPVSKETYLKSLEMALAKSSLITELKDKISNLEEEIQNQKILERAKGMLAQRMGITEQKAYQQMRKLSMNKRCSMVSIAKCILNQDTGSERLEQAKQVLIRQKKLSDRDAYLQIKRMARLDQISLIQAADQILADCV